jgi:hypothetical protein
VMVIQGPKLMKMLHGGAAPSGGSVAGALPPGVNPTAPSAAAGSSSSTVAADGFLVNLSRFAFKDPFHALVSGASAATVTPGSSQKPPAQAKPAKSSPAAAAAAAVAPPVTFTATKAPPNAAVLKTNGHRQIIFVGDGFPSGDPLFKLIALGKKNIRIGVLGGSFTSGAPTIKLMTGKRLTLANQADGSRYVLELLRLTTATPPPKAAAGTITATAATTTSTAATTTTTTTAQTTTTTSAG